jgi:hypothetical protein
VRSARGALPVFPPVGFPRAASRTRHARFRATGAPQARFGGVVLMLWLATRRDHCAPVSVARGAHLGRVEQRPFGCAGPLRTVPRDAVARAGRVDERPSRAHRKGARGPARHGEARRRGRPRRDDRRHIGCDAGPSPWTASCRAQRRAGGTALLGGAAGLAAAAREERRGIGSPVPEQTMQSVRAPERTSPRLPTPPRIWFTRRLAGDGGAVTRSPKFVRTPRTRPGPPGWDHLPGRRGMEHR